jgi:hypothetical protein
MGRRTFVLAASFLLFVAAPLQRPDVAHRFPGAVRRPAPAHSLLGVGNLPLHFEPVTYPAGEPAGFVARTRGRAYVLTPQQIEIIGLARPIRMRFSGAGTNARLAGSEPLPHKTNYLTGRNPSAWRTGVPSYARVKASGLYPGIEVLYYGSEREIEFDVLVAPRADPSAVRLSFDGVERLEAGSEGELRLRSGEAETVLRKPRAFQQEGKTRREVPVEYVIESENSARFAIGGYDPSRPLTVDPVISFSTHLGGGGEVGRAIAVDDLGNVYVAGETPSIQFPTKSPLQSILGGLVDAFVTKISADGSGLVYSTYLGGSAEDRAQAIAVDPWGSVYLTGSTRSTDFPIRRAVQPNLAGTAFGDAFITKLSADGSTLLYSTYLGGSDDDTGNGIAVDASGAACVVGTTRSTNFPTRLPLQAASGGQADAFVARLNPDGTQLTFSTYLGGSDSDFGCGIALDGAGNACITGATFSADFPLRSALQRVFSGSSAPFVVKLNLSNPGFVYSTYLGSGEGNAIAADRFGYVYVTGQTNSTAFPTVNAAQPAYGGGVSDAFASKIDPAGASFVYSTYLGGQTADVGYGIAIDSAGGATITGDTTSYNFPSNSPLQTGLKGTDDAFVAQLDATGSNLLFSTWLGGFGIDQALAIAVDRAGNIYLTGVTHSSDFPVKNGFDPNLSSFLDAFVVKLAPDTPLSSFLYFPQVALGGGYSTVFMLTNTGATTASGTLALTDKTGKPLSAIVTASPSRFQAQGSSFPVSVAAGAASILTAVAINAAGPQQTGWAFLQTTGGQLGGVATFHQTNLGALKSVAGVMASAPTEFAVIPVNNDSDQLRFTGFAVANPGGDSLNLKVVTLDESGRVLDTIFPAELNPLVARGQTARFLHELLPTRSKFRGSMALIAPAGKRFVLVALIQDHGLFTAIPVILSKPPGT